MRIFGLFLISMSFLTACEKTSLNNTLSEPTKPPEEKPVQTPSNTLPEPPKPPVVQPVQTVPNALMNFISSPQIDPKVEALADLGYERYQNNSNNLKTERDAARDANNKTGGGRKEHTWIKDTFDKEENEILDELKTLDAPPTFSIKEIDKLYDDLVAQTPRKNNNKAQFKFVTGVNVSYLHEAPLAKDALVQLASQFNYLESPGTQKTTILQYLGDKTQGPMGSIEAAAAAIHRSAAEDAGKLADALEHVLPQDKNKYYKNGYLELFKLSSDAEKSALRKHVEKNIKELRILPQWVKNEASGVRQFQIFSAAPSYQGKAIPDASTPGGKEEIKLVSALVASQFEAIAKLAVIRNLLTKKPVAVHLTRVGQGVFKNPPETFNDALKRVAHVVEGYPDVYVFIHGFGANDTQANIKATDPNLVDISHMDKKAFFSAKALDNQ